MSEYSEAPHEENDADGVDACEPSMTIISNKRVREERGRMRGIMKAENE